MIGGSHTTMTMDIAYILHYDTDYGKSEEWNYSYTPTEVFSTPEDREKRIEYLKTLVDEDGEPLGYSYMKEDRRVMSSEDVTVDPENEEYEKFHLKSERDPDYKSSIEYGEYDEHEYGKVLVRLEDGLIGIREGHPPQ